jgi:hypothetical protein
MLIEGTGLRVAPHDQDVSGGPRHAPQDHPAWRARAIAFYLPQFHPFPENDEWWGRGFTEWTSVARARPLFPGHEQPKLPGELGFYDLRVPEVRKAQALLAQSHGIAGFCYWHYWLAGRTLMARPFEEVLGSGEPDLPFCVGWANHDWTRAWLGRSKDLLLKQTYPGDEDHKAHFRYLLPAFKDPRYITVEGKPLVYIVDPPHIPQCGDFTKLWQDLAKKNGLNGIYFVGQAGHASPHASLGMDAWVRSVLPTGSRGPRDVVGRFLRRGFGVPHVASYARFAASATCEIPVVTSYPCVFSNWDNTPRRGSKGLVLLGARPAMFAEYLERAVRHVEHRQDEDRLIFIKSWNEWAEGNYLEPDLASGRTLLVATRDVLLSTRARAATGPLNVSGRSVPAAP